MASDEQWMQHALNLAREAETHDEVPVGAVVVLSDEIIGQGWNQPISSCDPTAHAEVVALRAAAGTLNNYRLPGSTLYVTLEPCAMCAGAIVHARVERVVFAVHDPRAGAAGSVFNILQNESLNHRTEISSGIMAEDCRRIIQTFFKNKRGK